MSKKRNLACLLVGNNKNWYSSWCTVKNDYFYLFQEDLLVYMYLRSEISMLAQSSLTSVRLFRIYSYILLDFVLADNFFINKNFFLNTLLSYNKFFSKAISFSVYYNNELENAFYIAVNITKLIEKRVKFRSKTVKLFIKKIKNKVSGVYVQCNGRLNNVDMARVDKLYLGCIPLQSMNFFLSYSLIIANTAKGLQSVKVWVCK